MLADPPGGKPDVILIASAPPSVPESSKPILTHDLADAAFRPAVPLQGFSHVWEVLQATETLRHDNCTEVGQFSTVSLVVRYVTEKWFAVALCENRPIPT